MNVLCVAVGQRKQQRDCCSATILDVFPYILELVVTMSLSRAMYFLALAAASCPAAIAAAPQAVSQAVPRSAETCYAGESATLLATASPRAGTPQNVDVTEVACNSSYLRAPKPKQRS